MSIVGAPAQRDRRAGNVLLQVRSGRLRHARYAMRLRAPTAGSALRKTMEGFSALFLKSLGGCVGLANDLGERHEVTKQNVPSGILAWQWLRSECFAG